MSDTLNDLAPWPATEADVTAESLARYLAVRAQAHQTHRKTASSPEGREWATSATVDMFGLVKLLRILQEVAPETADEAAKGLWSDWQDGAPVDEWLWSWLTEYGIDPEAVNRAAVDLSRTEAA
ncbi:hypothetical protein [Actinomadura rubrisoli]|uniref:Uncharacterized protein n=1 Tax=Actinomadura rubrisoli TaxID=2530368 RepID=A0A4R5CH25_9ACTN|nr:hypothetical protein [Actinomadura rubrisoli]TDD97593.1 hypothetical protein E1298_00760 [Actinomadura rubrisoli]